MKTIVLFVGLILYVQSVPHLNAAVLIATNATWKYLDNGTDQGIAWRSTAYNDSAWAAGPAELGYGEGDEATIVASGPMTNRYVTTYFRHAFNVVNPASYGPLTFRLNLDDGAVVYVNGTEIYRSNMPTGVISYVTLASVSREGGTALTNTAANTLNSGLNVVAVEVHQFDPNSSDLSFALELLGEPIPLVMRITGFDAAGAHLAVVGTPGSSVTMQYSDTATGPWSEVFTGTFGPSGVLLHTNAFAGATRAYRAVDQGGPIYSVNVVAVIQLAIAPGYAMIGNHLFDTNNSVAALFPSPPPGTSIYKIGSDNRFAVNNYLQGWSDTEMMLRPGDGVFIRNPTASAMSVAFKGELPQGTLVNQLPAGFTICSSIVPQSGALQTVLQFPAVDDDTIYVFNPAAGSYNVYNYFLGEWAPAEPVIGVGQAFWSLKGAAANWSRNFSVSGGGGNYTATQFAAASSVAEVNFLTYSTNTNKGRVFLPGGVTPVSSNFFGQLYAGTAASEASLAAIGAPAQFLGNAGYLRSGTVVIPSASPNDSRFFQLRAWDITSGTNYEAAVANGGGRGKSAIFSVVVGGGLQIPPDVNDFASFTVTGNPPAITTQPQSQTVVAGSNATFSVSASGAGPLGYQWFFSGTAIGSATSATLALNNVQAANAGSYRVVVNNAFGSVTSIVATLTVTQRGLIAAESFVYPVGSIVGRDGGVGFRGAYTGGGFAISNSLTYTDTNGAALPTAGGRYVTLPNPYQPAFRDFETNGQPAGVLDAGKFGAPDSIIYVGFLVRLDSPTNAFLGFGGVSLFDGVAERVFFGDCGFAGQLNWGVDRQLGSNNVRLSSVPVNSSTHLLVGRIDFGVEAATVRLYVDPPLNREPATASVTPFATPPFRFTTLRVASSPDGFSFDEIKLGTSYDDVVQAVTGVGPCVPTPSGLVSWWRGEGDAQDAIGTNHGALSNGIAFAAGNVGQAFYLDGIDDYVSLGSLSQLDRATELTVMAWIWKQSDANQAAGIVGRYGDLGSTFLLYDGEGSFVHKGKFVVVTEAPGTTTGVTGTTDIPVGQWTFIAGTWRGSNGLLSLYKNGSLEASSVESGAIGRLQPYLPHVPFPGKIGSWGTGDDHPNYKFHGFIDEVAIYDRALSASEIAAIYAAGSAGMCLPQPLVPAITGLSAVSGAVGSALFINGLNFSPVAPSNVVYFGTVRAVVSSATSTQLVVTVPAGAAYAPVSVTVAGLTGSSRLPFGVTFASSQPISTNLFAPPVSYLTFGGALNDTVKVGDMNGGGRNDVVVSGRSDTGFILSVMGNLPLPGGFTFSGFGLIVDSGDGERRSCSLADLDGDGKLDIVTDRAVGVGTTQWDLYANHSVPGMLGPFSKSIVLTTNDVPLRLVAIGDLDGDGRSDLLGKGLANNGYFALRNESSPGTSSFAAPVEVFRSCGALDGEAKLADFDGDGILDVLLEGGSSCPAQVFQSLGYLSTNAFRPFYLNWPPGRLQIAIADFDRDGKLDLAAAGCATNSLRVFRNISTPGNLTSNSFEGGVDFPIGNWAQAITVADFDGDGRPDIAVSGCVTNDLLCGAACQAVSIAVIQNLNTSPGFSAGSFSLPVAFASTGGLRPIASDLDGDGKPDLLVPSYSGYFAVWRNTILPPCVTPPADLIAWYPMDGSAEDISGHGNNGIVHGATPTANRFGVPNSAYGFNGVDNFIEVPDTGSFNFTYPVSLVAWVNPLDASKGGIVGQWGYGGNPDAYLLSLSSNRLMGTFPADGNFQTTSPGTLPLSNWTHVAMTFDGATVRYFINGASSGAFAAPPLPNDNINEPVIIGLENIFFGSLNYFRGALDDVLIFNRAVSSNEIAAIYSAGSAGMCPPECVTPPSGLVSWWRGNGNALDEVSGNHGALSNGTAFAAGNVGQAFRLDGMNDYVEVQSSPSLKMTNVISVEGWIKFDRVRSYPGMGVIGKGINAHAPMDWLLTVSFDTGHLRPHVYAGETWNVFNCNTMLATGVWHHVAMVYDGSRLAGYINGRLDGFVAVSGSIRATDHSLRIGVNAVAGTNSGYFPGLIDDIAVYNRALTSNEIAAIHVAGLSGKCPPQALQLTVRGSGSIIVNPQSQTYPFGSSVMISALPNRYHTFLHWSDGNTNSQRTITVGLNNDYTAIFTNSVPLETRTVKLWDRSFGGTEDDYNPVMKRTSDGGVIVSAQTRSGISGNKTTASCIFKDWAAWVLKLDEDGNKQWEQTIGTPFDFSVLYGVTQTSDGGYLLAGYVGGPPTPPTDNCGRTAPVFGGYDFWLVRLSTNGQRLWDVSFGGAGTEGAFAIVPTADGGFLLAGDSDSPSGTNKTAAHYGAGDGWIVRVDAAGNKLWDRSFGGTGYDVFGAAALMPDGGFLLAGSSFSPPSGNKTSPAYGSNDFWAVRVDANGNKLWERSYGGNSYDALLGLSLMQDGGAVLSGFSSSTGGGTRTSASFCPDDYWVVRIDASGNQLWDRAFGGTGDSDWGYRTLHADDGGLTVCGLSNSGISGNRTTPRFGLGDGWAVRLDAYGNKIGEFAAGGSRGNSFTDLAAGVNGEIFFAGDTDSPPSGNKTSPHWGALDVWVVKAVQRTAPVGTPVILVDGRIDPSNSVMVTNSALLEIQSTFPGGNIFFTLDGSDPDQGEIYTGPLVLTSDAIVRAVAYTANSQNSAEADPVVILVAQAPIILVQPRSQVVAAGSLVEFSVVASGEPPLRYQWFRNEAEMPGKTNSTLFVFGAQTSDAGFYSVSVANVHGIAHSADAALGIIEPPTITVQPVSVSVMLSNSVMFCVDATGGDPLRYQWRRNGGNIPNETNRCLNISPVLLEHGGTYEVIIANPVAAVISQPAVLRLILPLEAAGDNFVMGVPLGNRSSGILQSTNVGATKETGEPNHGGKPGGSSVWYRWTAPTNGIATFRTLGSSFDTLLAVYTGPNVSNLTVIASDEDSGGFLTSLVRFSAVANREYAIAVDGFGDTEGEFALSWELTPNANPLPVVLQQPQSQTVLPGTNVLFSVIASNAASYLWFRNGSPLYAETSPQLTIPVARPQDVGSYRVAVTNSAGEGIQSEAAILQIAFGFTTPGTRSADKIEDLSVPPSAFAPGLRAGKTNDFIPTVQAGSIAVQILNNSAASTTVGENNSCNQLGGRSEWFQIRALSNATMRIDTVGSEIDTILSVYRGTNVLIAPGLVPVPGGCDDDSGPNRTSIVRFPATNGVEYSIQVDGKNGTNGTVVLNLGLGFAPSNTQAASRQVARQGDNITLNCTAVGTPNPAFYWYRSNQTASAAFVALTATGALPLPNLQPDKQGTYTVVVSNFIASITNTIAEVVVQTNALIAAQTGFDSTMEGWTAITNGGSLDLRHSGAGGNPGGHLAVRTIPIAGYWYWIAPSVYLGNKFYCYNGSLSFELRQTMTDSLAVVPAEDVILEGAGHRLVINLNNPTASIWTTYRVPLNESQSVGWRLGSLAGPLVTRGEFLAVLTSLTNLMIRGACGPSSELGQIDSVLLLGATTPALSIRADGSDWLVEWPQALAGFSLQTVRAFQPVAATPQVDQWIGATQPPTLTNNLNSVRVPGLPTQQFFRLHKPAQ